jgi:hypothetical protein
MSFLLILGDFLLTFIVAIDTLGFIVNNRKNPSKSDQKDYVRLCFTWAFHFALKSLVCGSCTGFFGKLFAIIALAAKAYVSIPVLGGAQKLYSTLIEQNLVLNCLEKVVNIVKAKTGCSEATPKSD